MTTYYPIQTTVGLSAIGSTALESITAGEIIQPETPLKQPDLCDLIGVGHSWRPYENRPTIEQDPARAILGEKTDLGRMSVGALGYARGFWTRCPFVHRRRLSGLDSVFWHPHPRLLSLRFSRGYPDTARCPWFAFWQVW